MTDTDKFNQYTIKYNTWLDKTLNTAEFKKGQKEYWYEGGDFIMFYYQSGSAPSKNNILKYTSFSNFDYVGIFPCDLLGNPYEGIITTTSEHLYQAAKYSKNNSPYAKQILAAKRPHEAFKLGRAKNIIGYDTDWDNRKFFVMLDIIRMKAIVCPKFRKELLDTHNKILIENTMLTNDMIWGCGRNGKGMNYLGIALMILRDELTNLP